MSQLKMVTIKNKLSGFTRTVGEPEFNNMIDKADYDVLEEKSDKKEYKKSSKKKSKKNDS